MLPPAWVKGSVVNEVPRLLMPRNQDTRLLWVSSVISRSGSSDLRGSTEIAAQLDPNNGYETAPLLLGDKVRCRLLKGRSREPEFT